MTHLLFSERALLDEARNMASDPGDAAVAKFGAAVVAFVERVERQRSAASATHLAWHKSVHEHLEARERIAAAIRASRVLSQEDGRWVVSFGADAFKELALLDRLPFPTVIGGPA